jgi:anti-anti-sigma factor
VYLVVFRDEIAELAALLVTSEVEALLRVGAREIVIDLRDVSFIDSAALAELVAAGRAARRMGSSVTIACQNEAVLSLLRLVGLGDLETHSRIASAFEAVRLRSRALQAA